MRPTAILNDLFVSSSVLKRPYRVGVKNQSNPVLQMRKLRCIEVKVAQVHTSRKLKRCLTASKRAVDVTEEYFSYCCPHMMWILKYKILILD